MRVVHIVTSLDIGGAETVVSSLASDNRGLLDSEIVVLRNIVNIHTVKKPYRACSYAGISMLCRADVLVAHMWHSLVVAVIIKLLFLSKKIIFIPHSSNLEYRYREIFVYLTKFLRSRDMLFVGESSRIYLSKRKRLLMRNPVRKIIVSNEYVGDRISVLIVGRFRKEKGQLRLLSFISSNRRKLKSLGYQFIFIGDGPQLKQAKEYEEDSFINFKGLMTSKDEIYSMGDLVIIPSDWEGLPLVCLEALISKTHILSRKYDGIQFLGKYITYFDWDNLLKILSDYSWRKPDSIIQEGANHVLHLYGEENVKDYMLSIYESTCSRKASK